MKTIHTQQQACINDKKAQEDSFNQDKLLKLQKPKSLFNHLYEKGTLTEKDIRKLRQYKKLYLWAKSDMGAPRVTQSHIGSIASKFNPHASCVENETTPQEKQELIKFRNLSYGLHKTHRDLAIFVERLFEDPRNDFDFYQSWTAEQQNSGETALKAFTNLIEL